MVTTIRDTPDVLAWKRLAVGVRDVFVADTAHRLGRALAGRKPSAPDGVARLLGRLACASENELQRVVMAPEVTRLAWGYSRPEDVAALLDFALDAEESVAERRRSADPQPRWTVLGDAALHCDGTVKRTVMAGIPVDVGSPRACAIDLYGSDHEVTARVPPSTADVRRALDRLAGACTVIRDGDEAAWQMTHEFTSVIVLQSDPEHGFSSGSNSAYIGRTVLTNACLPNVDEHLLADAVLHEAIHAFLFMLERSESWFTITAVPEATISSPWSGRSLELWPYLQACFVWFGLLNFWRNALHIADASCQLRAHQLFKRAACGFCADSDLIARIPLYARAAIDKTLLDTLQGLQRSALETAAGA